MELAREHDEIDRLATLVATLGPGAERATRVHELCVRFRRHLQPEERYLHLASCRLGWDGVCMVAAHTRRNRAVVCTIEGVERRKKHDDEFDILVAHLVIGVQDHVEQHDTVVSPALRAAGPLDEPIQLDQDSRKGAPADRRTTQDATERADGQAGGDQTAAEKATVRPAHGGPRRRGISALLRWIVRGGPTPDTAH
jgi:hypothetical protein